MTNNINDAVEDLKEQNLQLKLDSLRKDQAAFKVDIHRHMDLIIETSNEKFNRVLEQTTKTNGSVARVMERLSILEREDNKKRAEDNAEELRRIKDDLKFFITLSNNKWTWVLGVIALYAFSISEIRHFILNWLIK